MSAYYYGFSETGVRPVDELLSAVAVAGKRAHHTEEWSDNGNEAAIQAAAENAAQQFRPTLITTEEELDALPLASVIRFNPNDDEEYGFVCTRHFNGWFADSIHVYPLAVTGVATVLFVPGEPSVTVRNPPIVLTLAKLNTLPDGAIILSDEGGLFERELVAETSLLWREIKTGTIMASEDIALPVEVLRV